VGRRTSARASAADVEERRARARPQCRCTRGCRGRAGVHRCRLRSAAALDRAHGGSVASKRSRCGNRGLWRSDHQSLSSATAGQGAQAATGEPPGTDRFDDLVELGLHPPVLRGGRWVPAVFPTLGQAAGGLGQRRRGARLPRCRRWVHHRLGLGQSRLAPVQNHAAWLPTAAALLCRADRHELCVATRHGHHQHQLQPWLGGSRSRADSPGAGVVCRCDCGQYMGLRLQLVRVELGRRIDRSVSRTAARDADGSTRARRPTRFPS